jgi:hypothetical protein
MFLCHLVIRSTPTHNDIKDESVKDELGLLLRNTNFVLLFVCYGMNIGMYYALPTLFESIVQGFDVVNT